MSIYMIPEVEDILDIQVQADKILIKPCPESLPKTKGGVLLPETTEDKIKQTMLTKGVIVNVGAKVEDKSLLPGVTVFYFKANSMGALRQGEDVYMLFNEYHIEARFKTIPKTEKILENV